MPHRVNLASRDLKIVLFRLSLTEKSGIALSPPESARHRLVKATAFLQLAIKTAATIAPIGRLLVIL